MKNLILKSITAIAGVAVVLAAGCFDAPTKYTFPVFMASLAWLVLFAIANRRAVMALAR